MTETDLHVAIIVAHARYVGGRVPDDMSPSGLLGEVLFAIEKERYSLRAEFDKYAAAIERVRKECDACEKFLSDDIWHHMARVLVKRIRSAIGDIGEQQIQEDGK